MKLQTPVGISPGEPKIGYHKGVVFLGSCFAGHMADKFDYFQFPHLSNPMGVIFHPMPLTDMLERAMAADPFREEDLFYDGEQWACYQVHGSMSKPDKTACLNQLNHQLQELNGALQKASHLVLTFGSAWGYVKDDRVVANCHKMPAKEFEKQLSKLEDLKQGLHSSISKLKEFNPNLEIILTVSPVRHLKDGMVENNHSKARLLEMVHQTVGSFQNAHYFPAYEIMMDELRDYRFYKADMIHPSQLAVDYIWDRFQAVWIDPDALSLQSQIASIRSRQAHRPRNPESPAHKEFLEVLAADIMAVREQFPHIVF